MRSSPWEVLIQQLIFLSRRAFRDVMAFDMATSKTKKSGYGAVLWVSGTSYHYLSVFSNMLLNVRVHFVIIELKAGYILRIFWKQ